MKNPEIDAYDKMTANDFIGRAKAGTKRQSRAIAKVLKPQTPKQWWLKYSSYLKSAKWKRLKERVIAKRGAMCERCGASGHGKRLDLHHLSYANVGKEQEEDVKLLCHGCHQLMHPDKKI